MGEGVGTSEVRLGLLADPDFPELLAHRLADVLSQRLSIPADEDDSAGDNSDNNTGGEDIGDGLRWEIEVEIDPVAAGLQSSEEILVAARERRDKHGWDYAICLTDLPVWVGRRPVLADANLDEKVAVVSLPACGGVRPLRRAQQVLAELLGELTEGTGHRMGEEMVARRPRWGQPPAGRLAPVYRQAATVHDEVDVRYVATALRGRVRLLTGMVRSNRPWRLIFGLSNALVAAVAISAFGLSSSTIWQVSDQLGPLRQVIGALGSVAVLVVWLIAAHHLWERRSTRRGVPRHREQVVLYNASTVLTLTCGVACLYLALFAINLAMAAFFIRPGVLATPLGHPPDWPTYLVLAWGFTTMGVFGGALGSSLESDQAVRQAAYGYREEQRRTAGQQLGLDQ